MYFPTAGIACNPVLPFLVSLGISFFTSMGGITGALLLLPFQMSVLGYVNPSVSATNQFFNVLACPSGVWAYWREGRMVWPLAAAIVAGTLPGVFLGAVVRVWLLPDPGHFRVFVALVLLSMGGRLARDAWRSRRALPSRTAGPRQRQRPGSGSPFVCQVLHRSSREIVLSFQHRTYTVTARRLWLLSLSVGLVGGVYGIGGGGIIATFLISLFGLPIYVVAGATLFATALTSLAAVGFYALLAPLSPDLAVTPDWKLGLLMGLGGMCGMYFGSRCQKFVPQAVLKTMLALIMFLTALRYLARAL